MQALSFYLTYPFIYLLASLPFPLMYAVSDALCFLIRLVSYRRDVIVKNLRNSFPEKGEDEIRKLTRLYYSYLCDLMIETFKTLRMTEAEHRERVTLENPELFQKFFDQNKSVMLVLGHYGNWEWMGPCITLNTSYQLVVIYRPLSNIYFERMMTGMRTRFGTRITPVSQTLRAMVADRGKLTATAFVADQAAPSNAHWTTFLHQETSVFTGPEKLGTKFNYPIIYLHTERHKRGTYHIRGELLFENPKETIENEISEAFTRRLEKDIIENPTIWLWSHKRWKHTRPPVKD
jgi:KDO2-lipid IV(A) lauroyltransferase